MATTLGSFLRHVFENYPAAVGIFFILCAVIGWLSCRYFYRMRYVRRVTLAPALVALVRARFTEFDVDQDGTITESDLRKAMKTVQLNKQERELLKHMWAELADIGHFIGTKATLARAPFGALGGVPMLIYGVALDDLKTYYERVIDTD